MGRSGTGGDQRNPADHAQQADSPGVSEAVRGGSRCASHEVSQMIGPVARRQADRTPDFADSAPSAGGNTGPTACDATLTACPTRWDRLILADGDGAAHRN